MDGMMLEKRDGERMRTLAEFREKEVSEKEEAVGVKRNGKKKKKRRRRGIFV